ncbi:MAG: RidA family protein [Bacteroidia bacterium]|nr:RidA family protein [Bacteroidia bacterium]HQV01496.1 RidA family protein [Bacteroidia bacterium]
MKKIINTENAPLPIGPYSQAVLCNNMLYVSGQIAINPATQQIETNSIADETHQVMQNIKAILNCANLNFDAVVKTTIFLKSMQQFAAVNEVYATYFTGNFPARETVEVSCLPKNVNVEISITAYAPN